MKYSYLGYALVILIMSIPLTLTLGQPTPPRTLSQEEEHWIVGCIERSYMKNGMQQSKNDCMILAEGLYEAGYFK
jgi:hypothetical protein